MKIVFSLLLILTAGGAAFAQNPQPTPQPTPEAPRISLADAKLVFDKNNAIFVDARSADTYRQEHIKGAVSIPLGSDPKTFKDLPRTKTIIVYCS
jgi:rhodanese-related sulfurtransferase